jgi:mRNA interferase RelE/StbE
MAFEIAWKPKAVEDLQSLDKEMQRRIVEKLEIISPSPQRFLDWIKKYGVHKLRVGDYRIFLDLSQKEQIMEVLAIRHRSKAYKLL